MNKVQSTSQKSIIEFTLDFEASVEDYLKNKYGLIPAYVVIQKSLDARNAPRGKRPKIAYTVQIGSSEYQVLNSEKIPNTQKIKSALAAKNYHRHSKKIHIIGLGPSGLFCALRLAEYGIPATCFERGSRINQRMKDIALFWRRGKLNEESNACYGEGGAGLFSDGKLITRIKSPLVPYVLQKLVNYGAPPEIMFMSNPHLGSNKIRQIITNLTNDLLSQGHQIEFNKKLEAIGISHQAKFSKRTIDHLIVGGSKIKTDELMLCMGHSAHEIYQHFYEQEVTMSSKPFAVGVRVEHPREEINRLQYGPFSENKLLGTARYRLSYHDHSLDKGCYSFCMCPGGHVLSTGTEANGLVTNGMSNSKQDSPWSNSAVVVTVKPGIDYQEKNVLSGLDYQRKIEQDHFQVSLKLATGKEIPSMRLVDFLQQKNSRTLMPLLNHSLPSKGVLTDLREILPSPIVNQLQKAFYEFDKNIKGFISPSAQLFSPETRTSAPITITRDKVTGLGHDFNNFYPCGEGAGYAGGITSAAVDGVVMADRLVQKICHELGISFTD